MVTSLRRGAFPLAFAALLGVPGVAPFHTELKSSSPEKDSVVRSAPREVRLTFTGRPELALSDIKVATASGAAVSMGKVARTNDTLTIAAPVRGPMPDGAYVVTWRTASRDGHVIRGKFGFTVSATAPAAAAAARPCASAADEEHAH